MMQMTARVIAGLLFLSSLLVAAGAFVMPMGIGGATVFYDPETFGSFEVALIYARFFAIEAALPLGLAALALILLRTGGRT